MNVNFNKSKKVLEIDDARIIFRNFSGKGDKYNREGDRNFAVVIPDEQLANDLIKDDWNVKIKPPREEGDDPFIYLPVKIKFNNYGPSIYVESGGSVNRLNEETIDMLDDIDIVSVSLDVRPYDWEVNGKSGRAAYLQAMTVKQNSDRFSSRYADEDIEIKY